MKKIFLIIAAILTLLLSGCQANQETDISAYRDDIVKSQEIMVISADTSEVLETITSKDDIEHFILALDLDKWKWKTLPDKAIEIGSFRLAQKKTIQFGQSDTDGTLYEVATITLYDGSYIHFEICGLDMSFEVSADTADYLNGYFS